MCGEGTLEKGPSDFKDHIGVVPSAVAWMRKSSFLSVSYCATVRGRILINNSVSVHQTYSGISPYSSMGKTLVLLLLLTIQRLQQLGISHSFSVVINDGTTVNTAT